MLLIDNNSIGGEINTKNLRKEENLKIKSFLEKQILDKIGKWNNDSFSFFDK